MSVPAPTAELDTVSAVRTRPRDPGPTWSTALERAEIFWLSTVRRDGRPHVTPLPAMWLDGSLYFCTGPDEQKAKNIQANPHCVLNTGNDRIRSGLDVVVEGSAVRTLDDSPLKRLAAIWTSKLEWAFDVSEGAFHDRSTETGGTAHVYAVAPTKVLAFAKGEPFSQTRYRFS
jgi:general stress protein 26